MTRRTLLFLLAVPVLLIATIAFACGDNGSGNGDDDGNGDTDQPTATEDVGDGTNGDDTNSDGDTGGGASLGDVPLPSGADEQQCASADTSQFPIPLPSQEIDPEAYTSIEFCQYAVDISPAEALDFYQGELGDWEEVITFSGDTAGQTAAYGVWTRNGGEEALWIFAGEEGGETSLIVMVGSRGG